MKIELQKEHQWLQKLVGDWTYEAEMLMKQGEPLVKSEGKESVRPLGGFWIVAEGQGEIPGCGVETSIVTLGYDAPTKRYVGTWIGSIMGHLWVYDGEMDAGGKVLTLHTEGPGMTDQNKTAKYKDVIEIRSDDHRIMTSQTIGDDGKWHVFLTLNYRRKQ